MSHYSFIDYKVHLIVENGENDHEFVFENFRSFALPRTGECTTLTFSRDRLSTDGKYTIPKGTVLKLLVQQVEFGLDVGDIGGKVRDPIIYVRTEA